MPNVSSFGAQTENAVVQGTVTDRQMVIPEVPPQGLMSVGPRQTYNFIKEPWNAQTSYVFYDAVKDGKGSTYIATKPVVPAGTPLTDEDYWFKSSDPNAQLNELQEIVKTYNERISQNASAITAEVARATAAEATKAPVNHASEETIYGVGNAVNYGHLKLADNDTPMTSGANDGIAATPKMIVKQLGVYNVKHYGAKGDGVTDDSEAIQNCINAAIESQSNANLSDGIVQGKGIYAATVYFPSGVYKVSKTVTLSSADSKNGVSIKGAGMSATTIVGANKSVKIFTSKTPYTSIQDLKFTNGDTALVVEDLESHTMFMKNVMTYNFNTAFILGVYFSTFINVHAYESSKYGFHLTNTTSNTFINCFASGGIAGFRVDYSPYTQFIGCQCDYSQHFVETNISQGILNFTNCASENLSSSIFLSNNTSKPIIKIEGFGVVQNSVASSAFISTNNNNIAGIYNIKNVYVINSSDKSGSKYNIVDPEKISAGAIISVENIYTLKGYQHTNNNAQFLTRSYTYINVIDETPTTICKTSPDSKTDLIYVAIMADNYTGGGVVSNRNNYSELNTINSVTPKITFESGEFKITCSSRLTNCDIYIYPLNVKSYITGMSY